MLDTLQVIFWSITYVLIILAGFQSRSIRKVSMPYVAGVLNFSWEICALYHSGGMWSHILWLSLDAGIVYFNFVFLSTGIQRTRYAVAILICSLLLFYIFAFPMGMLISVFVIDLIMAAVYLLERNNLSPRLKVPIAVTKLIGDTFAALFYAPSSAFVAFLAVIVFLCNCVYLYLCAKEIRQL